MRVYLLRHGEADWPLWEGTDDERPLTPKGKKEMRKVGRFLAKRAVSPDVILSSPLLRARQTAAIAADALDMKVVVEPMLAPGFTANRLKRLIAKHGERDMMIVGHEPDFSGAVKALTGAQVKMAKGGLVRIDLDDTVAHGALVWLLPPRISAP